MVKIYDKASWHIDCGEDEKTVIDRFKAIFDFLNLKELLNEDGKELFDLGIDNSVSIHENLVTDKGKILLDKVFDDILKIEIKDIGTVMEKTFSEIN